MKKFKMKSSSIFSMLPWFWLAGLACLVLRAKSFLGFWPSPAHPDPKLLPFELHHMLLSLGFYLVVGLFPIAVAVYIFNRTFFAR